jgi:hypothetical protein
MLFMRTRVSVFALLILLLVAIVDHLMGCLGVLREINRIGLLRGQGLADVYQVTYYLDFL